MFQNSYNADIPNPYAETLLTNDSYYDLEAQAHQNHISETDSANSPSIIQPVYNVQSPGFIQPPGYISVNQGFQNPTTSTMMFQDSTVSPTVSPPDIQKKEDQYLNQKQNFYQPSIQTIDGNYLPRSIQYQCITVDQWNCLSVDRSNYSFHWSSPEAFSPESFSTKLENKTNDTCCMRTFWAIFILMTLFTVIIRFTLLQGDSREKCRKNNGYYSFCADYLWINGEDNTCYSNYGECLQGFLSGFVLLAFHDQYPKDIAYVFLVALGVNLIHLLYSLFLPTFYLKFGFLIQIFVLIASLFIPHTYETIFKYSHFGICLIICVATILIGWRKIKESTDLYSDATKIARKYPSLFFVIFLIDLMMIVSLFIFFVGVGVVVKTIILILLIPYLFFFIWCYYTFRYVAYLTVSGVMSLHIFLGESHCMPKHPVWFSFSRAMTKSFGSAARAALACEFYDYFETFIETSSIKRNSFQLIFACISMCCIRMIECCWSFVSYHGLFYCAAFGVPFKEGCRRFLELKMKKYVSVLLDGYQIRRVINLNHFLFAFIFILVGFEVSYRITGMILHGALGFAFAIFSFMSIYGIFTVPMLVAPESYLMCFVECPDRFLEFNHGIYNDLSMKYIRDLDDVIKRHSGLS